MTALFLSNGRKTSHIIKVTGKNKTTKQIPDIQINNDVNLPMRSVFPLPLALI
jgi:hypothetical protein